MKRRMLSLALALVMSLGLSVSAMAAAPEAAIKDMQTHEWTVVSNEVLEPVRDDVDDPWSYWFLFSGSTSTHAYNPAQYHLEQLVSTQIANFMLYDNGELYLSTKENPDAASFAKVMDNVKEIGIVYVPLFKSRTVVENQLSGNQWATYNAAYTQEWVATAGVTTILTQNGELHLMGCPNEILEENYSLTTTDYAVSGKQQYGIFVGSNEWTADQAKDFRTTVTIENLFPFSYQSSLKATMKIADGIERIVPGYAFTVPIEHWMTYGVGGSSSNRTGNKGFYVDKLGNSYFGFPTQGNVNQMANENVIDYIPSAKVQMLEDGAIYRDGQKIAANIKDFGEQSYLTNDGALYDYAGKRLDSQVKSISDDGYYYIKEDDSLWCINNKQKIMEDVATTFCNLYPVRSSGEVYRLDRGENNNILPKRILEGNGYAPNPIPSLHDGKVFKNASNWALVDLRTARNSGLTLPVDGLVYNQPITREKFAEITIKLYEKLSGKSVPSVQTNPFADTKNPEILKAYSLGIVNGTSNTTFSPQNEITREGIATMLKRTVDLAGTALPKGTPKQFVDAEKIDSWALEAVEEMAAANVVKGVSADRFGPKDNATIEQAVIMANRILQ